MPVFALKIKPVTPSPTFLTNARGLLSCWDSNLKREGAGYCHGLVTESELAGEIEIGSRAELDEMIIPYAELFLRLAMNVTFVVNETVPKPLTVEQRKEAAIFGTVPARLTLKYFNALPEGTYLMSNLMTRGGNPIFTELVSSSASRSEQWERIRTCGAAQRACHVFRSAAEGQAWIKAMASYR